MILLFIRKDTTMMLTMKKSRLPLFFSIMLAVASEMILCSSRVDAFLLLQPSSLLRRQRTTAQEPATRIIVDDPRVQVAPICFKPDDKSALSSPTAATLVVPLSAAASAVVDDDDKSGSNKKKLKKKKSSSSSSWPVTLWVHLVSIFVLANYYFCNSPTAAAAACCWPAAMATRVSLSAWSLVHALSGMLFSGGIVTTTVLEWRVVQHAYKNHRRDGQQQTKTNDDSNANPNNQHHSDLLRFWFHAGAPAVERWLVLPAVTGSLVSGVAQAALAYGRLRSAPRHVKSSLHLLLLLGLWWGATDRTTQRRVQQELVVGTTTKQEENDEDGAAAAVVETSSNSGSESNNTKKLPLVLRQRRASNLVSCAFLAALYAVMVLKPGYHVVAPP